MPRHNLTTAVKNNTYDVHIHVQDQGNQPQGGPTLDSSEVLDEIITRSRGEIRHARSPKVTSSTQSPREEMQSVYSPRRPHTPRSPRLNEIRTELSPRLSAKGIVIKQTPSPRPSMLGQASRGSSSSWSDPTWLVFLCFDDDVFYYYSECWCSRGLMQRINN